MDIFIFLFVYLLILRVLIRQDKRLQLSVLGGLGLWLVLALRSSYCGVDLVMGAAGSANYYNMFVRAGEESFFNIIRGDLTHISSMETGWLIYCKLVSFLTKDFQIFMAITALIQISLIGFVLYKYSIDIILSYIVYFCFGLYVMSFSGLRQSTAFSITFFSYYFLEGGKKLKFVLVTVLASLIHSSSLIFLIALPLRYLKLSSVKSVVAVIVIVLLLPFLSVIVTSVVPLLFENRYQHYQDEGGSITLFLVYVLLFLLSLKIKYQNQHLSLVRNLIMMAAACQSLGYIGSGAITRIGFYFSIFFTLLYPELVRVYSDKKNKEALTLILSVALFGFFYLTNKDGYLNVVPYYFFWENVFLN